MEAFAIDGSARPHGNLLLWNYKVFNIGRDDKLREWGQVEAVSNPWGEITEVKVLSRNVPEGAPARRAGLDEANFEFPLCCLPHTPVRMGDEFADWRQKFERGAREGLLGGKLTSFDMQSLAVGVLTEKERTYLVVEHRGGLTSEGKGLQSRSSVTGYWLIDISNGLKSRGIMRNTIAVKEGGQESIIVSTDRIQSEY
jgi:hypothetical protein